MASIFMRGRFWWILFRRDGKNIQYSLKTTDKNVAKFRKNEIENQLAVGDIPIRRKNISVSAAFSEFLDHCTATVSTRTVEYYGELIFPFIRSLPPEKRVLDLNDKDIIDYLNTKPHIKTGMTWHIIKSIKTFFNFCVKREYAKTTQITLKKPRLPKQTPECWSKSEIKKILDATENKIAKALIIVNIHLGLRPAELIRLKWTDIDWQGGFLTIREAKDSEFRHVLIHKTAMDYFKKHRRSEGQVFPGVDKLFLRRTSRQIKKASGMKNIRKFWYATRHTFATEYYKSTGDLRGLQRILGHSKIEMTTVYVNPQEDYQRQQINKLNFDL